MAFALIAAGCMSSKSTRSPARHNAEAVSGNAIADLALANVGGTACGTNSLGGTAFESSCTGYFGQPEYWCSDFAKWVWESNGIDTTLLSAAAGMFGLYGHINNTFYDSPQSVGDAVLFNYDGGTYADHVAIVTAIYGDGSIETVSGDWDGENGTDEATFSSTSSVMLNSPSYDPSVGSQPWVMGSMTISGYVEPAGGFGSSGSDSGSAAGSTACAGLNDGFYCGGDPLPGDSNTLYECRGGNLTGSTVCANNCQRNPGVEDDSCGCAGLGDGGYCGGDDVTGDPNTLYQCNNGTLSVSASCTNGCAVEPSTIDDRCN
jgi:hypothetical protein